MHQFMLDTEVLPQEKLFPFFIFSDTQENIFPPAPGEAMCSRIYERVLSCVDISDRPGSKTMADRVLGDEHVDEKSHQLSYMVVHLVSQLQVVAVDVAYEQFCTKFRLDEKNLLILASQNASLVGLLGVLNQLRRTSYQLNVMKTLRISAGEVWSGTEDPWLTTEEYRLTCTHFLEIEIIQLLLRYVQKAHEFGLRVANDTILTSRLWRAESFKVMVWEALANAVMIASKLFVTTTYPFIEAYTSNIARHRPIFRKYFMTKLPITAGNATEGQMIKCSGIYDMDIPELKRQYPDIVWNREAYDLWILQAKIPKELKVIKIKQVSVEQMLGQTTPTTSYYVDVPIDEADVQRHMIFAGKAADRRVYNSGYRTASQPTTLVTSSHDISEVRLTGNVEDDIRNVRPRVIREGPIRPSLSQVHLDEFEDLRDLYPPSESDTSNQDITYLTYDENIVTVTALDPGIAIATEIDPLFRRHNPTFRYYARVLE